MVKRDQSKFIKFAAIIASGNDPALGLTTGDTRKVKKDYGNDSP